MVSGSAVPQKSLMRKKLKRRGPSFPPSRNSEENRRRLRESANPKLWLLWRELRPESSMLVGLPCDQLAKDFFKAMRREHATSADIAEIRKRLWYGDPVGAIGCTRERLEHNRQIRHATLAHLDVCSVCSSGWSRP